MNYELLFSKSNLAYIYFFISVRPTIKTFKKMQTWFWVSRKLSAQTKNWPEFWFGRIREFEKTIRPNAAPSGPLSLALNRKVLLHFSTGYQTEEMTSATPGTNRTTPYSYSGLRPNKHQSGSGTKNRTRNEIFFHAGPLLSSPRCLSLYNMYNVSMSVAKSNIYILLQIN